MYVLSIAHNGKHDCKSIPDTRSKTVFNSVDLHFTVAHPCYSNSSADDNLDELLSPKFKKRSAPRLVSSANITNVFQKMIDRKVLLKFASAGFIFNYNYGENTLKHDCQGLGRFKPLLSEMLKLNSIGFWSPNMSQDAISKLEEKTALNCHHTESV